MVEYFHPLIESGAFDYASLMKTPMYRVLLVKDSLSEYNLLKNYQLWLSYPDKDDESASIPGKEQHGKKDKDGRYLYTPTWEEWEVKSAFEYDTMYLPKLGDDGWKQHGYKRMF